MRAGRALAQAVLVVVVGCCLVVPRPILAASATLGTVRGQQTAKLSLDGGKSWLALGGRSLPVLSGTEIRSGAGNAQLALSDGSRISVMPFSALRFAETPRGTEISLVYGRLAFSLPQQAHLEIVTPTARLEPAPGRTKEGELFVTGAGLLGLKMSEGTLNVRPLSNPNDVMVASLEPVFLPRRPSMPGTYFGSDTETTPPAHAKAVFTPNGQSIGYVGRAGSLVIYPGYTNDLTRPFSPKLVRLAMTTIPGKDRTDDATPLFDVNGGYVGYLAGPVFYAQAPSQPPTQATPTMPAQGTQGATTGEAAGGRTGLSTGAIAAISAVSAVGIGVGVVGAAGGFGGSKQKKHEPGCPPRTTPPQASPQGPPPGRPPGCD